MPSPQPRGAGERFKRPQRGRPARPPRAQPGGAEPLIAALSPGTAQRPGRGKGGGAGSEGEEQGPHGERGRGRHSTQAAPAPPQGGQGSRLREARQQSPKGRRRGPRRAEGTPQRPHSRGLPQPPGTQAPGADKAKAGPTCRPGARPSF